MMIFIAICTFLKKKFNLNLEGPPLESNDGAKQFAEPPSFPSLSNNFVEMMRPSDSVLLT